MRYAIGITLALRLILASTPAMSQTTGGQWSLINGNLQKRMNVILAMMGYTLFPDVTTSSLSIKNAASGDPSFITLAHQLAMKLTEVRKKKVLPYLGPDGKTQVTVEYRDGKPLRVDYVVIAASHTAAVVTRDGKFTTDEAKQEIIAKVVRPVVGDLLDKKTTITVNGTGKFLVSGPQADTGLTGRKIIVDTYGGWAVHGGGAFSGKDPTKVDRSAGYMARYVAKNIVAAGLAEECLVQLGYCIGLVDPVSVMTNTYGTGKLSDEARSKLVRQVFPLSPGGIIDHLKLRQPVYYRTAAYGHFGRKGFAWERVDATKELLARAKNT